MPILSGGGVAGAASASLFHAYDEVGQAAAQTSLQPQGSLANNSAASFFWTGILGGGHGWAGPGAAGPMQGIRARQSNGAGVGARTEIIDWRMGQRFTTNNPALAVVRQRRFTFQCAVAANGNGAEIAVRQQIDTFATANTVLGYGLIVTAGNWAGIRRLVTGGATAVVPVLQSMSAVVARRVKFIFTEGPTPVFEAWMDNLLLYTISGEANMPELTVPFGVSYGPCVTSVAGVVISTTAAELLVEYL